MSKDPKEVSFSLPKLDLDQYLNKYEIQSYHNRVLKWTYQRDYYCGAFAAMAATFFTHPLDVMKVRFQLQGELRPPGSYQIKYRNMFQAARDIFVHDGIGGFYKGATAGFAYQLLMNVIRLFIYEKINRSGITSDVHEEPVMWRQATSAVISGTISAVLTSPAYLVKIQTQSQAHPEIAVGWQHGHHSARTALWNAMRGPQYNLSMFQGGSSAVLRMSVASSAQLLCFTSLQKPLYNMGYRDALTNSSIAAAISSVAVVLISNPCDVISTRMYNQEPAVYYKSIRDCITKIIEREGWRGFYKGAAMNYIRTVPHMILTLLFWNQFKQRGIDLQLQHQEFFDAALNSKHSELMEQYNNEGES